MSEPSITNLQEQYNAGAEVVVYIATQEEQLDAIFGPDPGDQLMQEERNYEQAPHNITPILVSER